MRKKEIMEKNTKILIGLLIFLVAVIVCWFVGVEYVFKDDLEQNALLSVIYSASN